MQNASGSRARPRQPKTGIRPNSEFTIVNESLGADFVFKVLEKADKKRMILHGKNRLAVPGMPAPINPI